MSNRERFIIGGVGGLAPVLIFLATGDFTRFFTNGGLITAGGYCVRAAILFFLGGFVVCLYRDETVRMKIFQLGLGAPAMIAGLLSASTTPAATGPQHTALGSALVTVVYAQASTNTDTLKHFTLSAPSALDQFVEGLTGLQPKDVWFVIAGSFQSSDNAKAYAKQINESFPTFHADPYAPYGDSPYYTVVIGANLTQRDARVLRDKAVSAGLSKQTYYKTFANLPLP